jgi:8-oxo-dGTP pyrophosphatase MutT (NUDIX family)
MDCITHSSDMGIDRSKALQRSRLLKKRQQVAAVCYRVQKSGIEFLLVQTRDGRWIFPKGGAERGLTHAQSAALEAVEEAGVHGRIEEMPFARYFRRRPDPASAARSAQPELAVAAHLCEVSRLERPQESNRNPTWFSGEKAKQRLLKDRAPEFGAELARVVDRALSRIQRLRQARNIKHRVRRDDLQESRLEAFENSRLSDGLRAALVRNFLRHRGARAIEVGVPKQIRRSVLRLGAGTTFPAGPAHNITEIDSGRRANLSKASNLSSGKPKIPGRLASGRAQKS